MAIEESVVGGYRPNRWPMVDAYCILALISAFFCPVVAVFFTGLYAGRKSHSTLLLAMLVGLCSGALAYGVNTTLTADIDRYTASLSIFRETSLLDLLSIQDVYSSVGSHGYNLFAWIVAQFGDDQLLRSAVVASFYSVVAYIVDDFGKLQCWSQKKVIAAFFVCIAIPPFFNILSYAKSTPAFSLLLLTVYLDFSKKARWSVLIILYALAASVHSSVLPIVGLRFVYLITKSEWLTYGMTFLIFPTATFLVHVVPDSWGTVPVLSFFVSALDKFQIYSEFSGWGWAAASQNSILLMGYRYFFMGIASCCILLVFRQIGLKPKDFLRFGGMWSAFCIIVSIYFEADIFFRYAMPCSLFFVLAAMSAGARQFGIMTHLMLIGTTVIGLIVQWAYLFTVSDISHFALHAFFGVLF